MTDRALLAEASIPRTQLASAFVRREHPRWHFVPTGALLFMGVTFLALMTGGFLAVVYLVTQDHVLGHGHDGAPGYVVLGTIAFAWVLFGVRILPRYVRSHTTPTRDAIRDGDLFDVQLVDVQQRTSLRPSRRIAYKLYLERDGACFHIFSPVPGTQVLHRLNTHVAFTIDRAGRAHASRAVPIW